MAYKQFRLLEKPAGFFIEKGPNNTAKILNRASIRSEHKMFPLVMKGIESFVLNPAGIHLAYRFLAIIHQDLSAEIYTDESLIMFERATMANKNIKKKKGDPIYFSEVVGSESVDFQNIQFQTTDLVIFCSIMGWKFGVFFDLTGNFNKDSMKKSIAELRTQLTYSFYKKNTHELLKDIQVPYIITEGKTDILHLKKAKEKLNIVTPLNFVDGMTFTGDQSLIQYVCKNNLATLVSDQPIICIFDRDNKKIIDLHEGQRYRKWNKNVFSFCIPIPQHRRDYKNISIEFYYSNEELATTSNGKRILWDNEIEKKIINGAARYSLVPPKKETEFDKKIFDKDFEKNNLPGISKSIFANLIYNDTHGFDKFNFSQFREIFNVIECIVEKEIKLL